MNTACRLLSLCVSALLFVPPCLVCPVLGDEPGQESASDETPAGQQQAEPAASEEEPVTTHGTVVVDGQTVNYTATAGKLAMKDDQGKVKAHIFFVAYTRNGVADMATRPVTFCFNGGPGSSSVWLHLGMLGPKRVKLPDDATTLQPPYRLTPNPWSLLDQTDLVFIDPVSTGYSRPAKGEKKGQFHGYDEDLRSVGQFIHDYTTDFQRWGSPKFVLGESYGGLRAAGLAGTLRDRYNFELNGIVLVSAVVDFQTLRFGVGDDLPHILFLPSYAATAWYHKVLSAPLQALPLTEVVKMAENFALHDYATILLKGDAATAAERDAAVDRYAELTGLDRSYVEGANLRISMARFGKQLLRQRRRTVGRFDSRYLGVDRDHVGERYEYDASGAAFFGPFTATMNQYLRNDLEFQDERVYEILTGNVFPWSYGAFENRYVDASETLRSAMVGNPHLQVFAACGYYDLATPFFAMDHSVTHLGLPPEYRDRITRRYYEAGHMMYVHEPSLIQLRKDLIEFYQAALKKAP